MTPLQILDVLNAYREVAEELASRIKSLSRDTRLQRIAEQILNTLEASSLRGEELLAVLYLVLAKTVLKYSVESEHPCHCDANRVSTRTVIVNASIAKLIYDEAVKGEAARLCKEYQEKYCELPPVYT